MLTLKAATAAQRIITAAISISVILLATPVPYGKQSITFVTLAASVADGIAIGLFGSGVDGAIGYRLLLMERFFVWATLAFTVLTVSTHILTAPTMSWLSLSVSSLATALLEIILPDPAKP